MSALTVISHTELASASQIQLNSIPGTYTDLMIVASLRLPEENPFIGFRLNGISSGITHLAIGGDGSGGGLGGLTRTEEYIGSIMHANATANAYGTLTARIPNYAISANKTVLYELFGATANTACFQQAGGMMYSTSSPITSITIYNWASSNLSQYSSITLYGITAGSSGGVTVS